LNSKTKPYQLLPRRAGLVAKWGLLVISVAGAFLYWPSKSRRIEWQISDLTNSVSHEGTFQTQDWLDGLEFAIRADFANSTAVTVDGVLNGALSRDQISDSITKLAASSTLLRVRFEHASVELSREEDRAQFSADAIVEITKGSRTDRERRHVSLSLQREGRHYRIIGVEASLNIVNLPEPRP
jgi:hypothetical protein